MRLSEITILKGIQPILIEEKPIKKTHEVLSNLINTKDIEKFIVSVRNLYKLPIDGLDINDYIGKDLYEIGDVNINALKLTVDDFAKSTGLPQEFALEIFLIAYFNAFIDLKYFKHEPSEPLEFVFGRRNISDKMWEYDHEIGAILIPFHYSKTKIKKWIDEHLDAEMDKPKNNWSSNPFILGVHNNLLIESEIIHYKDSEKKTFPEIVSILKERYPKENINLDRVKKIYYDGKQRISLLKDKQQ